jgi:predicted small secreted protein
MGSMKNVFVWVLLVAWMTGLSACHTMVGVGEDLQGAGQSLSEWDKDNKAAAAKKKTLSKDNPYR